MTVPWNLDQAISAMTDGTATLEALYDECRRLIAENNHLRVKLDVSQGVANAAISQLERITGERDRARATAIRAGAFE